MPTEVELLVHDILEWLKEGRRWIKERLRQLEHEDEDEDVLESDGDEDPEEIECEAKLLLAAMKKRGERFDGEPCEGKPKPLRTRQACYVCAMLKGRREHKMMERKQKAFYVYLESKNEIDFTRPVHPEHQDMLLTAYEIWSIQRGAK